ncbi:MAG TPA: STT3 domain-containing protein, partial [Candidatus Binatia bacterium]|nr:STT3 domain-containing protein [Candidatus Binatia bacterium]
MADDDVSMLSFFRKKRAKTEQAEPAQPQLAQETSTSEETSVDLRSWGAWIWKHRATLTMVILLLSVIVISWSIRIQSSSVPAANDWATNSVLGFIQNDIASANQIKYPNLPQQNLAKRISDEFQSAIRQPTYTVQTGEFRGQTFGIADQIGRDAAQFRSFFQYEANGKSFTYMPDIDPYTWLRYARNYIEHGDIADERRNGAPIDNHMYAPVGGPIENNPHPYLVAWLYEIIHVFSPSTTLMQGAGYLPLIVIALSVIPVFFIGRRVAGTAAGFFAALVFVTNGALLGRTLWGHVDTDGYNVFFPLMVIWCFLESYYVKDWLKRALLLIASGILTGLFAWLWVGWWYVFDFVLAVAGIYFAYLLWVHRKEWKSLAILKNKELQTHVLSVLLFIAVSGIVISSIFNFTTFWHAPLEPIEFMQLKNAAKATLFPNVLTTVAELNEASLGQAIGQMGGSQGISFIFIAVIGLLLLAVPRTTEQRSWTEVGLLFAGFIWYFFLIGAVERLRPLTFMVLFALPIFVLIVRSAMRREAHQHGTADFDVKLVLFLIIWFLATMYASTKGIRFVMLLVPAFSIAFGAGIGLFSRTLGAWGKRLININPKIITGVVIAVFALIMIAPTQNAYSGARTDLPIVNDGWYNTLTKIKDESKPSAIITSWWDFGHHFKYYADRPVTFDGASQNEPMAHWVGKMLLTSDEKLAVGILRMLHCGSTKAFDTLDGEVNDVSTTVTYLNGIFKLDKAAARKYLIDHKVSPATADETLKYTHCDPPEAFFIASGDMIGKSGVWAHFGSWNFERADVWIFAKNMPHDEAVPFIMKNNNVNEDEAEQLYSQVQAITTEQDANSWIAPWPSYNADLIGCDRDGNKLTCGNGIEVDLDAMDA